jgi:hypothetical protein
VRDLRFFSPFVDWALAPIRYRCEKLGVSSPEDSVWSFLIPLAEQSSRELGMSALSTPLDPDLKLIQSVVAETGWLSWVEYIHLILASLVGGNGSRLRFFEWSRNERQLQREVRFLEDLMKEEMELEPFVPILKEVIRRCLAELELKKRYPEEVRNRHRDFYVEGRSLSFGATDLENDNCKDNGVLVTRNGLSE